MNGKLLSIGALCAPVILAVGIAMTAAGSGALDPATSAAACIPQGATVVEGVSLSTEQWTNAATIIDVGIRDKELPVRAAIIAVATAMQESTLHNYGHLGENNDHDSLGLFQQRPSARWGTPEQIMDPVYSAGRFYDKLVTIPGWDTAPLTVAAQAVQVSAYPDAYAKWEPLATRIVTRLTAGCSTGTSGPISAAGWTSTVPGSPVCSGYRTPERPTHDGVDLCAARGTPIRAASAGVVVTMMCNASTGDGAPYSCDVDGSPSILGCGWYVEILHTDATVTRYCHMGRQPEVAVGQTVSAGQQIGYLGSSGNSSGPHLHLETHTAYPAYSSNATEPTAFFSARGVQSW